MLVLLCFASVSTSELFPQRAAGSPRGAGRLILPRSLMLFLQSERLRVPLIFKCIYNVIQFQAPREPRDVAGLGPGSLLVGMGLWSLLVQSVGWVAAIRGSSGDGPVPLPKVVTESWPLACLASSLRSAIYQPSNSG